MLFRSHISVSTDADWTTTTVMIEVDGKQEAWSFLSSPTSPVRKPSGQLLVGAGMTPHTITNGIATSPHKLNTNSIFKGFIKELKLLSYGNYSGITGLNLNSSNMNSTAINNKNYVIDTKKYQDIILDSNPVDRKSTRLNSSHSSVSRMPSSA